MPAVRCSSSLRVLVLGATVSACRSDAPPPGVADVRIDDPMGYHAARGFVRMVPPAHLPSSSPDRDQVEVWIKLPEDRPIEVERDEQERPTLRFAPGTWADRVEFVGRGDERRIVDIRGARIEAGGRQTFYVYRPTGTGPRAPLFGLEWDRDDAAAHAAATERLVAKLAEQPYVTSMPAARRDAFLRGIRGKNRCAGCHARGRADNRIPGEHGRVDRGTDLSGFFTPSTVLWDEVVLESYGAHDRSWSNPAIEVRCGEDALNPQSAEGRRCPDGSIARGRLRWDAVQPRAKAHLAQVCASRAELLAHMTPPDRAKMAPAAGPCGKTSS